jgi:D-alanine-D-alanine ligase
MTNILVAYGGVSPEHEVSIITALQIMHALKAAGYSVFPLYVSKTGEWYLGDTRYLNTENYKDLSLIKSMGKRVIVPQDGGLKLLTKGMWGFGAWDKDIDAVFPVFHGSEGEDGTVQGLLELSDTPYVGCGVTASAVGIDKYLSKKIASGIGLNVADDFLVTKCFWETDPKKVIKMCEEMGDVFIKPVTLGSSIGITRAAKKSEYQNGLEVAFLYADRIMVEKAVKDIKEINISVMGNGPYEVSVTERPVSKNELLSFDDKYVSRGKSKGMAGSSRIIPADLDPKIIKEVETAAVSFFEAIGGTGIARVDFMVDKKGVVYFNEINTLPGSLAFYLWDKSGVDFASLVDKLVKLAIERTKQKSKLITHFKSNILANMALGGVKK